MSTLIIDPKLQAFVDEEVRKGHFASADRVIAAGLARLMLDSEEELDHDMLDAIERADSAIDRGEGQSFEQVAAAVHTLRRFD